MFKVAVNDVSKYAVICEGVENISNMIVCYALVEVLQLRAGSVPRAKLESDLVVLYASMLTFLTKAKRYFSSGSLS